MKRQKPKTFSQLQRFRSRGTQLFLSSLASPALQNPCHILSSSIHKLARQSLLSQLSCPEDSGPDVYFPVIIVISGRVKRFMLLDFWIILSQRRKVHVSLRYFSFLKLCISSSSSPAGQPRRQLKCSSKPPIIASMSFSLSTGAESSSSIPAS